MNTIFIVLPILTLLMFQLGIELNIKDFGLVAKRPKPVIIGLFGQIVLIPLLAFFLGCLFRLEAVFFIGLMLIACSPGGSSSNVFSMLAKGDLALSISLTAISTILTLFTLPTIMAFIVQYAGAYETTTIQLPVGPLIVQNLVLMLLPIVLGVFFRYKFPEKAQKTGQFIGKIAFPALIVLITIFFFQHYQTIFQYIGKLGLLIFLLILFALLGGLLLCRLANLKEKEKRTIIIEIGIQNSAQAITIASSPFVFNNDIMAIPAIIYALLMNIVLLTYIKMVRR